MKYRTTPNNNIKARTSKGFTLIEIMVVLAIIGLSIALVARYVMDGYESSNERQIHSDLSSLAAGAVKFRGAEPNYSGVNCNTLASDEYATVSFDTCTSANPFDGNYTMTGSGSTLTGTATSLPTEICARVARSFTSGGNNASCSGGTLSVVFDD